MRKFPVGSPGESAPVPARWRPLRIAWIGLIVAILAPMVVECASLYHAKWSAILGKSTNVKTPILDRIHESYSESRANLCNSLSPYWSRIPSSPKSVLTIAAVSIVIGMFVLRMSGSQFS
jgi:hypothetical protein